MRPPERSAERDRAIIALLPAVSHAGWTRAALVSAAGAEADLLFPGGASDMIETYSDLADRWMEEDAAQADLLGMRLPDRVRAIIALRLNRNRPYRAALRRALGWLALPANAVVAARCMGRTADAIWRVAGDRSSDFSWYTKRLILAGVYGTTLLRWVGNSEPDEEATLSFLDRRLADIARLGQVRRRLGRSGRAPNASKPQPT